MNIQCWIMNIEFEYWIWMLDMNVEFEYWIWILNLNVEFEYWILNLNIEFEYWIPMLNLNIKYWIRKLYVTGAETYLKESGSISRLQTPGDFVSAEVLMPMGWGWVVLFVGDYCAQRMVVQYLLPGTMVLTATIVEFRIYSSFGWIFWRFQN